MTYVAFVAALKVLLLGRYCSSSFQTDVVCIKDVLDFVADQPSFSKFKSHFDRAWSIVLSVFPNTTTFRRKRKNKNNLFFRGLKALTVLPADSGTSDNRAMEEEAILENISIQPTLAGTFGADYNSDLEDQLAEEGVLTVDENDNDLTTRAASDNLAFKAVPPTAACSSDGSSAGLLCKSVLKKMRDPFKYDQLLPLLDAGISVLNGIISTRWNGKASACLDVLLNPACPEVGIIYYCSVCKLDIRLEASQELFEKLFVLEPILKHMKNHGAVIPGQPTLLSFLKPMSANAPVSRQQSAPSSSPTATQGGIRVYSAGGNRLYPDCLSAVPRVGPSPPHPGSCSRSCLGFGTFHHLTSGTDHNPKAPSFPSLFRVDEAFCGYTCDCYGGYRCNGGSAFSRKCTGTVTGLNGYCDECEAVLAPTADARRCRHRYDSQVVEVNLHRSAKRAQTAAEENRPFLSRGAGTAAARILYGNRVDDQGPLALLHSSLQNCGRLVTGERELDVGALRSELIVFVNSLTCLVANSKKSVDSVPLFSDADLALMRDLCQNVGRHPKGKRFSPLTHSLAVFMFNTSPAALRIMTSVSSFLPSASSAKRHRQAGAIRYGDGCGIYTEVASVVRERFIAMGYYCLSKTGEKICCPLQVAMDATAVREIIEPITAAGNKDSGCQTITLVGFEFVKCGTDSNSTYEYNITIDINAIDDLRAAFLQHRKAGYAFVGLYTALVPGLPHVLAFEIGTNNSHTAQDLSNWMVTLGSSWTLPSKMSFSEGTSSSVAEILPVVAVGLDLESKKLNYVEKTMCTAPSDYGRRWLPNPLFGDFFSWPSMGPHGLPLLCIPDPRHVINLGWHQLLKLDKALLAPFGVAHLGKLLDILECQRKDPTAGIRIVSHHFNPAYKQDKGLGMDLCSRPLFRALAASTAGEFHSNLALVVMLFLQSIVRDIYVSDSSSDSSTFSLEKKIMLAGMGRYVLQYWRCSVVQMKKSGKGKVSLRHNFLSTPLQKGLYLLFEGVIHRVRIQRTFFPNVPISFTECGSQCVESFFRRCRQVSGGSLTVLGLLNTAKTEYSAADFLTAFPDITSNNKSKCPSEEELQSYLTSSPGECGIEFPDERLISIFCGEGKAAAQAVCELLGMKELLSSELWENPSIFTTSTASAASKLARDSTMPSAPQPPPPPSSSAPEVCDMPVGEDDDDGEESDDEEFFQVYSKKSETSNPASEGESPPSALLSSISQSLSDIPVDTFASSSSSAIACPPTAISSVTAPAPPSSSIVDSETVHPPCSSRVGTLPSASATSMKVVGAASVSASITTSSSSTNESLASLPSSRGSTVMSKQEIEEALQNQTEPVRSFAAIAMSFIPKTELGSMATSVGPGASEGAPVPGADAPPPASPISPREVWTAFLTMWRHFVAFQCIPTEKDAFFCLA